MLAICSATGPRLPASGWVRVEGWTTTTPPRDSCWGGRPERAGCLHRSRPDRPWQTLPCRCTSRPPGGHMSGPVPQGTLAGLGEDALLARIFPHLPGGPGVLLGPGDDTALVAAPGGSVLATTDAMVRQRDWRDDWSTGADVGAKAVAQNCADIAAMGGVPTGLLFTLGPEPATSLAWVEDFARGLGEAARAAGVPVLGGDLSSAPEGTLV